MNPIQQFNELNQQFSLDFTEGTFNESIGVEFTDNNIYKAKSNGVLNGAKDVTRLYPETVDGRLSNKAYGYERVFCNKSQITGISINLGISGAGGDPIVDPRNIILDASFLSQFPRLKNFYFNHYNYGRNNPDVITGRLTGEWANKLPSNLEKFEINNADYPNTTASFDLSLISSTSKLKEIKINSGIAVATGTFTIRGDLSKIPNTCETVILSMDRPNSTVSDVVTGFIPSWVKTFVRTGRNTIVQNLSTLNSVMKYLSVEGNNELSGSIPASWSNSLTNLRILGNNIISGSIPSLSLCNGFYLVGKNNISGSIPSLPVCTYFLVQGNNTLSGDINNDINLPNVGTINITGSNSLSGTIKTSEKITYISIAGNNTIDKIESLPNCTSFYVGGKNRISGNPFLNLPKAALINIAGQNIINVYSKQGFANNMSLFSLTGNAELNQSMVDQLLVDLNEANWSPNGQKTIIIKGLCAAPGSIGLTAIANLEARGIRVTTN